MDAPQVIDLGYRARPQFKGFHARRQRWACLVAHRRAGKTVACVMDALDSAIRSNKVDGRYAYIAPFFVQAKDAAWLYVKRYASPIPGVSINESELRVDFAHNGARLRLYGADNYDRMRGGYLDGAVLDEFGDMHPAAWAEVIRPMLADRHGWATFIGTPKGRNEFYQRWEVARQTPADWFALMLKGSESGIIEPAELEAMRLEMTPEQYAQEIECDFNAAVVGSYYGKEIATAEAEGRICEVQIDPVLPVQSAWDLGMGDSTAIWCFQVAHDGVRIVDCIESHSQPLSYYVGILNARGYRGTDWVPHDAKVRELGTGRSRIETLQQLGRSPRLVPAHKIGDGINAARVSFSRFCIDEIRCRPGIEALRQYREEFDEKRKVFKSTPLHDWTSHFADAWRYLAMAWREMRGSKPSPKPSRLVLEADEHGRLVGNMSVREIVELKKRKRLARRYG